jgi:Fe-S-cluster containining protein
MCNREVQMRRVGGRVAGAADLSEQLSASDRLLLGEACNETSGILGLMAVYSLSIHADYRCRHSGACCTADWDVPVELPLYKTLDEALNAGRIAPAARPGDDGAVLIVEDDLPDAASAMVARTATGDCVFYDRSSGLCVIHRDLGEPMLPATCRHFPRLAVQDRRGTFISLTHFCPTAAASLFRDDVPIEIVEGPPAFPEANYEGLSVRSDDWPPLLRPDCLADIHSYTAWERHMVSRCANEALSPEGVVATLERDARMVRTVFPVTGAAIVNAIGQLPADGVAAAAPETLDASLIHYLEVLKAVPDKWRPDADTRNLAERYRRDVVAEWRRFHAPLRRYLAAKAFASWTAYQGRGFLTIVRGLDAALALVRVEAARQCRDGNRPLDAGALHEAFRHADFTLNHLAAGDELAEGWSKVEA